MSRVVILSGGVGGAKLVAGFAELLAPEELTVIVNTGDDFTHWGLRIAPDLDTVMYTLAGLAHSEQGWGLEGDRFTALAMVERYGGPSWFRLGDRDLATHLVRSEALRAGATLTAVTARLCAALGVGQRLLPMCDEPRRTVFDTTTHGALSFQEYFVRHRFQPVLRSIRFEGAQEPTAAVLAALAEAQLVVFAPSNPYVSIDPIVTLRGVREVLERRRVVAVSPIVRGAALKGAAAKMMLELGEDPSAAAVARRYRGLVDLLVVEEGDGFAADELGVQVHETSTIMRTLADKRRLAAEVLERGEDQCG